MKKQQAGPPSAASATSGDEQHYVFDAATYQDARCLTCGRDGSHGLDHSHIKPRSLAPGEVDNPANQILQCRPCHTKISRHEWTHTIVGFPWERGGLHYVLFTLRGEELRDIPVQIDERLGCLVERTQGIALAEPKTPSETQPVQPHAIVGEVETLEDRMGKMPDAVLVEAFADADRKAGEWFLIACGCVWVFRNRRQEAGPAWTEEASELFGRRSRTLHLYASVWEMVQEGGLQNITHPDEAARWHRGVLEMLALVPRADRQRALQAVEQAVAERGDIGPAEAAKVLEAEGIRRPKYRRYTLKQLLDLVAEWGVDGPALDFLQWLTEREADADA